MKSHKFRAPSRGFDLLLLVSAMPLRGWLAVKAFLEKGRTFEVVLSSLRRTIAKPLRGC